VEYKQAELEHFLSIKGVNGALVTRKSNEKVATRKEGRDKL
jgi:hypothetical protein